MASLRQYETTLIFNPDTAEPDRVRIKERVVTIITEQFGGEMLKVDEWGRRALAYKIGSENYGYYIYHRYFAPGEAIKELERILRITDSVIKFLTVRLEDDDDNLETPNPDLSARAIRAAGMDEDETDDDDDDDDDN